MSQSIQERVTELRSFMHQNQLDAFIIPRADEYLGEYVPACNERLLWISGFTGSAGVAVILADQAAIFTDGRYTVQVRQQVDHELFSFHHLIDEPYLFWACQNLNSGARIGVDSRTFNLNEFEQMEQLCAHQDIQVIETINPVDQLWTDRPAAPNQQASLMKDDWAGLTSAQKRAQIGGIVAENEAQAALITAPDSIMWLLNIRGSDIPCLPVVLSSAILYADGEMKWYVDPAKVPEGFTQHVGQGVTALAESSFAQGLDQLAQQCTHVLADPASSNAWSQRRLTKAGVTLIAQSDPCLIPKAAKNLNEIDGMREAHRRDALAEVRFLAWLDEQDKNNTLPDEAQAADKLQYFRYLDKDCVDLSFDTISAAAVNAAMCHYNYLNVETPAPLLSNSSYLVDSGGQYLFGTTDITRTVALGEAPAETKYRFTLVLKGMIALSRQRFPKGTTGTQLDALARQYLWNHGLDFDHGTGHGVGHFLSVHEGPQRISKALNRVALLPGMVISNEPGYYQEGDYGIRCENLLVVEEADLTDTDRPFYQFATLTHVPFDRRMLQLELLTDDERQWLNDYHQQVYDIVKPQLEASDSNVLTWLTQATAAI